MKKTLFLHNFDDQLMTLIKSFATKWLHCQPSRNEAKTLRYKDQARQHAFKK